MFYVVNKTRSVALARYPLAIPFRPHTVEKQYKDKVSAKDCFMEQKHDFKKMIKRILLNVEHFFNSVENHITKKGQSTNRPLQLI